MATFTDILKEKLEILAGERGDKQKRAVRYAELDKLLSGKLGELKKSVPSKSEIDKAAEQAVDARAWDKFDEWFKSLTAGKYGDQIKAEFDRYVEQASQLFRTNAETATLFANLFAVTSQAASEATQLIKDATELLKDEVEVLASDAAGSASASATHAAAAAASATDAGEEAIAAQQSKVQAQTYASSAEASNLLAAQARDGAEGFATAAEQSYLNARSQASAASASATTAVSASNSASAYSQVSLTARNESLGYANVTQQLAADVTSTSGVIQSKYSVKVDVNGYVTGFGFISPANNSAPTSLFTVLASNFLVAQPIAGGGAKQVFEIGSVDGVPTLVLRGNFFGDGVVGARAILADSIAATHIRAGIVSSDKIAINGVITDNITPNAVTGFVAEQQTGTVYQASQLLNPSIVRRSGTRALIQIAMRFGPWATHPNWDGTNPIVANEANNYDRRLIIRRHSGSGGWTDLTYKPFCVGTKYSLTRTNADGSGIGTSWMFGDWDFVYQWIDTNPVSDGVVYSYEIIVVTASGAYEGYPGGIQDRSIVVTEFKR